MFQCNCSENSASFVTEEAPGDKSHSEDLVMSLDAYEGSVGPEDIILPFEYRPNPILEDIQPRRAFLQYVSIIIHQASGNNDLASCSS